MHVMSIENSMGKWDYRIITYFLSSIGSNFCYPNWEETNFNYSHGNVVSCEGFSVHLSYCDCSEHNGIGK